LEQICKNANPVKTVYQKFTRHISMVNIGSLWKAEYTIIKFRLSRLTYRLLTARLHWLKTRLCYVFQVKRISRL